MKPTAWQYWIWEVITSSFSSLLNILKYEKPEIVPGRLGTWLSDTVPA
jgi:hypothetical protein